MYKIDLLLNVSILEYFTVEDRVKVKIILSSAKIVLFRQIKLKNRKFERKKVKFNVIPPKKKT